MKEDKRGALHAPRSWHLSEDCVCAVSAAQTPSSAIFFYLPMGRLADSAVAFLPLPAQARRRRRSQLLPSTHPPTRGFRNSSVLTVARRFQFGLDGVERGEDVDQEISQPDNQENHAADKEHRDHRRDTDFQQHGREKHQNQQRGG